MEKMGIPVFSNNFTTADDFSICTSGCSLDLPLTVNIKCYHNIKGLGKIECGLKKCQILFRTSSGNITINTSHKYYTQIVGSFCCMDSLRLVSENIPLNKDHWEKIKTNLEVFFNTYLSSTQHYI